MANYYTLTYLFLVVLLGATISTSAQEYRMGSVATVNDCSGYFVDSGGDAGNYSPNESLTTLFCPDNSSLDGTHVRLSFSGVGFDDAVDDLCFYDGQDDTAPLLSCASDFHANTPFIIQATAANTSGCVYVTFNSDGSNQSTGWNAIIECVPSCQQIEAVLISTTPAISPADTGYIDVCIGERITLSAEGRYPQNGLIYDHSDLDSEFEWDMGDGTIAYGLDVTHAYEESGGYIIQLKITDQFSCSNTNFINQRVRVSTQPDWNIGGVLDDEICVGDSVFLTSQVNEINPDKNISVQSTEGNFIVEGVRSDSLALPDGTGIAYETSITFTEFSPGQTLQSINDLLGICVNMEHSWMRDLEISITCPSGNSVILHNHPANTGSGVYLGEPNNGDGTSPIPGQGYNYCWTSDGALTWLDWANRNDDIGFETLPSGDYASFENLQQLVGCSLNGEWTIKVQDLWGQDNGFIFSWSINFDPKIYPRVETFEPELIEYAWDSNPTIFSMSADSIGASPQSAGTASYRFGVIDDFGCAYDTTLNITVLPETHPDCYNCGNNVMTPQDTSVCGGDVIRLDVRPDAEDIVQEVEFEAYPLYSFGFANHPPALPYESAIAVNSINPPIITDPLTDILSVCIDIETNFAEDLAILLKSPSGAILPLSTNNGGGGQNYTNTCFTPDATTPINRGTAPFTGIFSPEGDWTILAGSPTNGDWVLLVSDAFAINDYGELKSWSISFKTENDITYNWTPSEDLSCNDCPTPEFTPTETTTYTVNTTDSYGCEYSENVEVQVINDTTAPIVDCGISNDRELTYSWNEVSGITNYEVSINGGEWVSPNNGNLSHIVSNAGFNDDFAIEVRPVGSGNLSCPVETGSSICRFDSCTVMGGFVDMPHDPRCYNTQDGFVNIAATGGERPYMYSLDGGAMQADSSITGIGIGMHTVIVSDVNMCADTLEFELFAPDSIELNLMPQDPSCNGFTNGAIETNVMGGTPDPSNGTYNYNWSFADNTPNDGSLLGVVSGDYSVTVVDANGCMEIATITLNEPEVLEPNITAQQTRCADTNDGMATAMPTGGTSPYTYNWGNGDMTATADELPGGDHTVIITDANGCTVQQSVNIPRPPTLAINTIREIQVSCFGGNDGMAYVDVSGGTPDANDMYEYVWSDDLAQNADTAVLLTAGNYMVTVMDSQGCSVSNSVTVTEPTALEVMTTVTNVNCKDGNDGIVLAEVMGGIGPYTFLWDDDNNQTTITATELPAGTFTVTVTDANGCETPREAIVDEPDNAVTIDNLEQTFTSCFGENRSEAFVTPSGGSGIYTYNWSNNKTEQLGTELAPGETFVTVTDNKGCIAVESLAIEELDEIMINVVFAEPTCFGFNDGSMGVNIATGGIAGAGGMPEDYTYQWSTNPITNEQVANNLVGGQSYTVTVTDAQFCKSALTRMLPQPSEVSFNTNATDALCFGDSTGTATISDIVSDNSQFGFTYTWDSAAGDQETITATELSRGDYEVTVTDSEGCEATRSVTIGHPTKLNTDFTVTDNICFGEANGVASVVASGGTPGYLYNWSNGENSEKVGTLLAGKYYLTITDVNGCQRVDSTSVNQPTAVVASLETQDVTCFGDRDGFVDVTPSGGTPPYLFSLDNENFNGASTIVGLTSGDYNVYVRDANNCGWFEPIKIDTPEEFTITIAPERAMIEVGDSMRIWGDPTDAFGKVDYFWSTPYEGILACNECNPTVIKPINAVYVEIYAVDENGCEAEDRYQVMVQKTRVVVVPTGFTPNNDNLNDKLMVHGKEGSMITTFRVYDRWGEQVYQADNFVINDANMGWDGTFRNQDMPPGNYVWYLEVEYLDGVKETLKGSSVLIR